MGVRNQPELFEFSTASAVEEFGESTIPELQIVAEYSAEVYNDLYVADDLVEEVGGREAYERRRENVESFLRLDLVDRDSYTDIVPRAGPAELFVTRAANVFLVRTFRGDSGLFVSVHRNGSVDDLLAAIERFLDGDGGD